MKTNKILLLLMLLLIGRVAFSANCSLNAGVDQTICSTATLTLTGDYAGLFPTPRVTTWSQVSGPSAIITSPNSLITTVTGLIGAYTPGNVYKFRLTSTCEDGSLTFDEVNVTIVKITAANAGVDLAAICPGTNVATLAGNAVGTGETGVWTKFSGGTGLTINTTSSPTSTLSLAAGSTVNTTLRWTITNTVLGCSTFDDVIVPQLAPVTTVSAGPDQTLSACYTTNTSTTLAANYVGNLLGQVGNWTVVNGPNKPTITTTTSATSTVTGLIAGTYTLRWTVTGTCTSGVDDVIITVPTGIGAVSTATASISGTPVMPFCDARTQVVLVGNTPKGDEIGTWTQTSGAVGPVIATSSSPITAVTGLSGSSSYTFTYTISRPGSACTSAANVSISYGATQTLAITTANPYTLACGTTSATINYTQSGTGTTQYSILSGPVTVTYPTIPKAYASAANPLVLTGLTVAGTYVVRLRKSAGTGSACSTAYDDITIVTSVSPTASNAGSDLALNCTVTSSELVGNAPSVGTGKWTQVSGPNTAVIPNPLLARCPVIGLTNGNYVFRWIINSGKCTPTQDDVNLRVASITPTTASANLDQNICNSTPLYLHGNTTLNNETGTWTVSPTSGITFSNINSPTAVVTGLAANSTYTFTWTINNACGTSSDNMIVTTSATVGPIPALAGPDQCLGTAITSVTMAGNDPSPGTGLWTKLTGSACTITVPTSNLTTITGMANGTYTFEWAITRNECTTTKDTVMITISAAATTAVAMADIIVCGNSTSLAGTTALKGTGTWTQVAGNGMVTISNINSPTATLSNLTPGVYTYRWTISNDACTSNYKDVMIYVSTPPTTAYAGVDQALCGAFTSTKMAADSVYVGKCFWSFVKGPNLPTFTNDTISNTTITGLTNGTYIFSWNSINGPFCNVSTDEVTVTVTPTANAGVDQVLCEATSANLMGNLSSTGTWTQVGITPSVATITTTSGSTATVSGLVKDAGVYTFRYTIGTVGCTSSDDILVSSSTLNTANAGPDQSLCNVTSWTMAATAATGGAWTRISGPNTPTLTSTDAATTVTGAIAGTYVYEWRVTNGNCISVEPVTIIIYALPSTATATNRSICGTSGTLSATAPTTGIGRWSQVSGPNTATLTSEVDRVSPISNLVAGTYHFLWTVTNGPCASSTKDITVTVTDNPTTPNAGADQNICGGTTATLVGNTISSGSGTWTKVSGPSCTITTPGSPNSGITGMTAGTYVFQWTATLGACPLNDQVTINLYNTPTASNAGTNFSTCLYSALNLAGNTPTVGTGLWTQLSGAEIVFSSPTSATTAVVGATPGSYVFRWTISNGTCTPSSSDITVTVNDIPTTAVITGANQSVTGTSVSVTGNTITVGTGLWSKVSGPIAGGGTITSPTSASTSITGLVDGTYIYRWTSTSGVCTSFDEITITKNGYSCVISNKMISPNLYLK